MKCDQCEQEATVHELRVMGGKRVERHLCEACARREGMAVQPPASVPELIEKFLHQAAKKAETQAASGPACGECGLSFAEFKNTGILGCPACYQAFESQLGPLLERSHEGATHHVGKTAKRLSDGTGATGTKAIDADDRAARMAALSKQLEQAVAGEHYERAAALRDELRRVSEAGSPPTGAA
ncbi:MAG: UvrB/UvrC motif-containing protein [Phycisphaerales bacterium]